MVFKILLEYQMDDCEISKVPIDPEYSKHIGEEDHLGNNHNCRRINASTNSRPGISVAVSLLNRKINNLTKRMN